MPNKNLTEIVLVVDRSGSMASCKNDAEGGINTFISEQKELSGDANFTLVQFDSSYEFVHNGVNIKNVGKYTLEPRGSTALLDAVGRAINETGQRLDKMKEEDKPALVVVVIVTDGEENSSHEYSLEKVKSMITEQTDKYSWKFTFLGAGVDAFQGGLALGIDANSVQNFTINNAGMAYTTSSACVSRMRSAVQNGSEVITGYTEAEIADLNRN